MTGVDYVHFLETVTAEITKQLEDIKANRYDPDAISDKLEDCIQTAALTMYPKSAGAVKPQSKELRSARAVRRQLGAR